jgi:hypothetical protein
MNKSQGQPVAAVKNKVLSVKSGVRAGALTDNHNRQLVVKSGLRAGSLTANHNRRPLVA